MDEPIGWIYEDDEGRITFSQMAPIGMFWESVYRVAPKREWQGLTDEEIKRATPVCADFFSFRAGVRYVENRLREETNE